MTTPRSIEQLEALVKAYGTSHLGILSGPAIRHELSQLTTPVDILALDWRKLHEWNDLIGYAPSNDAMSQAARVDYAGIERRAYDGPERRERPRPAAPGERRLTRRVIDLRGQFGGDELVMAVDPGHGVGLLTRILRQLAEMNGAMPSETRADISARTGGLLSGFGIAAVLVTNSTDAYHQDAHGRDAGDVARAVAECGNLKRGIQTGERATSGARGTVIGRLN